MKNLRSFVLLLGFAAVTSYAGPGDSDPGDWFENRYAPLWQESPWDKLDEIVAFYAETIADHPAGRGVETISSGPWIAGGIDGWKADGWVGSTLAGFRPDRLNLSTAVFKARWLDVYADGREEYTCGWYMANFLDDGWRFTAYADIDCAEHGF